MTKPKVAVIGAGAAGYFGAIRCAETNKNCDVYLFEATTKPLTKVRISGGGRCNVTHNCFDIKKLAGHYPRGQRELVGPFSRFQPQHTIAWFAERGVNLKAEADGRMFPTSDDSATIVNCLQQSAERAGVKLALKHKLQAVKVLGREQRAGQFELSFAHGYGDSFAAVLFTTGGMADGHHLLSSLGHTITQTCPSLFTFKIEDEKISELAGVSFANVAASLECDGHKRIDQQGPLLVTHWGLSGPAILRLSAWGARALASTSYQANLTINFLPQLSLAQVQECILTTKREHARKLVINISPVDIPQRFWERLCELTFGERCPIWADLRKADMQTLINYLHGGVFRVDGKGVFKEEFVTCGGVDLREVDFRTMQSKVIPGIYFAGEVLDVDGITGGFNFQNAWTTSWIAGGSIAESVS